MLRWHIVPLRPIIPDMAERETLASRLGFILLSAGCAIGLGNVWRFPYITGQYGGAAFVLMYLVFLIIIGLPVMVMEFSLGRASGKNISLALRKLEPNGTKWHLYGPVAIAGNYLLMMFYTTITGWLLYYFASSAIGTIEGFDPSSSSAFFSSLQSRPSIQIIWMAISIITAFLICLGGLRNSVEKASKIMMICLLAILIVLAVNSCLLPGAREGLSFYLVPDLERAKEAGLSEIVFAAMSQAFFTLSIGMGGMTIFGSYIGKEQSLTGESIRIIALDTFVAITAGLIIFPACFSFGITPGSGPGLLFVTLPSIFSNMNGGRIWGTLFFLFMTFAAMTTLIAVFENIIAYWMDNHGWSRKKAVAVNMPLMILLSVPCVLGYNLLSSFQPLGEGTAVLDLEDFLISSTIMPLGSLLFVIFCAHNRGWGWKNFINEADTGKGIKFPSWLRAYVKWILPIIIGAIFLKGYWDIFSKL